MRLVQITTFASIATLSVMTVLAGTAQAQNGMPANLSTAERMSAERAQSQTQVQARQTIENLFSRLCPGRCELVDLQVQMANPTPVGEVSPGFENVAGQNFEASPESIDVTVLLDSKLPRNFQSNLPRMIRYRLGNLAPTVNVRPEILDFPEPQLEPVPPYMPEPPRRSFEPPPMPEPQPAPEPEPVVAEEPVPEAEPTLWERLEPFVAAIAPWIGPILMMLVLFALLMALVKRLTEASRPSRAGDNERGASPAVARPDVEALRDELNSSRAIRNRVLRRWLGEDEEGVARAVRLLGPQIVSDLKSDPSLKPALERVSEFVATEREPLGADDVKKTVGELEARLTAARIVHDDQKLSMDWEFLEGLAVNTVRRILAGCSSTERMYVVAQLPPALRAAYLEGLEQGERRQLVLGTSADLLSKEEALALAARLRKAADDVSHIGKEADGQAALVIDMLSALQLDEQEQMLRDVKANRPELSEAVLGRVMLETTTLHLPAELLADAIHRSPVETMSSFLQGTRATIRDHLLSVAPPAKKQSVVTELSLEVPVSKSDFLAARESFLAVLRDVSRRDGVDLVRANTRALMTTSKINPVPDEASV